LSQLERQQEEEKRKKKEKKCAKHCCAKFVYLYANGKLPNEQTQQKIEQHYSLQLFQHLNKDSQVDKKKGKVKHKKGSSTRTVTTSTKTINCCVRFSHKHITSTEFLSS